jgi:hypothetical protein
MHISTLLSAVNEERKRIPDIVYEELDFGIIIDFMTSSA